MGVSAAMGERNSKKLAETFATGFMKGSTKRPVEKPKVITISAKKSYQANNRSMGGMGSNRIEGAGNSSILESIADSYAPYYEEFVEKPSVRKFLNFFTKGVWDRALHPEEPLSLDHWVASAELVLFGWTFGKPVYNGTKTIICTRGISTTRVVVGSTRLKTVSTPRSATKQYDYKGDLNKIRFYDNRGKMYLDIHYTNHGNPLKHPQVPHEHYWILEDGIIKELK